MLFEHVQAHIQDLGFFASNAAVYGRPAVDRGERKGDLKINEELGG